MCACSAEKGKTFSNVFVSLTGRINGHGAKIRMNSNGITSSSALKAADHMVYTSEPTFNASQHVRDCEIVLRRHLEQRKFAFGIWMRFERKISTAKVTSGRIELFTIGQKTFWTEFMNHDSFGSFTENGDLSGSFRCSNDQSLLEIRAKNERKLSPSFKTLNPENSAMTGEASTCDSPIVGVLSSPR